MATRNGFRLFGATGEHTTGMRAVGLEVTGTLDDLLGQADVVVDCTPKRVAANAATLLRLTASLEHVSEHPLAAAIVGGARERNVDMSEVTNFASATGKGVTGTVDGRTVAIGNLKHLEALGIDPGQWRTRAPEAVDSRQQERFSQTPASTPERVRERDASRIIVANTMTFSVGTNVKRTRSPD